MGKTGASEISPAGMDIIAKRLMSLKGLRLFRGIFTALVISIFPILCTLIDGTFKNNKLVFDVTKDYANISLYIIGLPLCIYLIAQYAGKFSSVIENLRKNQVILIEEDDWNDYIFSTNSIFNRRIFLWAPYLVSLIITISLTIFYRFRADSIPVWYSPISKNGFHLGAFVQIPVYLITYYVFSLCLLNICTIFLALKKLFGKYKVRVQALHPDNCGGLSPLGSLSKKLNIGIILIGIIAGLNIYRNSKMTIDDPLFTPFSILIISIYIICSFIVFFIPLYAAHKSMKTAKYEEIKRINDYFLLENNKIKINLDNNEPIDRDTMENIENSNKLYAFAKKMPIYPFNLGTVSSFFGSIFIPIFLYVIETIIQKFL
jgi:hypothetical protein